MILVSKRWPAKNTIDLNEHVHGHNDNNDNDDNDNNDIYDNNDNKDKR